MSLISSGRAPKPPPTPHECPRCHRAQKGRALCSACARTPVLFAGLETGPKPKAVQFSLFGDK
jgi:hypothetical protein